MKSEFVNYLNSLNFKITDNSFINACIDETINWSNKYTLNKKNVKDYPLEFRLQLMKEHFQKTLKSLLKTPAQHLIVFRGVSVPQEKNLRSKISVQLNLLDSSN